jgi:hypothetical protein
MLLYKPIKDFRCYLTNLTKRMGTSQLTKQHGDELTPTGESFSMTLCLSHRNQLLKLQTRKQLQQLD